MSGDHLYISAQAPLPITVESLSEAVRGRWPEIKVYAPGEGGDRELGFFAPVNGREVDCSFYEGHRFMTVDLGEEGASVGEWFLQLAPEDVPWLVFTEQETDGVPVSSRATARELLDAVHWRRRT